nr:thioredoxin family protein [Aurantimonas endophytica]
MFEQAGCPFCRNFDREIAPGYADSRYGRIAPLRRVDIRVDRRGGLEGLTPAVFTPTFVLVDDAGREVARLEGYPGEKWFYPELAEMVEALGGEDEGKPGLPPKPLPQAGATPAPE